MLNFYSMIISTLLYFFHLIAMLRQSELNFTVPHVVLVTVVMDEEGNFFICCLELREIL